MAKKSFSITLQDDELDKQLKRAYKRNPTETAKATRESLLDLAGESARRAPVDTGDLRNDCTAELNGQTVFMRKSPVGGSLPTLRAYGSVTYGLPYALRQHEVLTYKHPRGGEAKYLERPFDERKERYIRRFEKIVEELIK